MPKAKRSPARSHDDIISFHDDVARCQELIEDETGADSDTESDSLVGMIDGMLSRMSAELREANAARTNAETELNLQKELVFEAEKRSNQRLDAAITAMEQVATLQNEIGMLKEAALEQVATAKHENRSRVAAARSLAKLNASKEAAAAHGLELENLRRKHELELANMREGHEQQLLAAEREARREGERSEQKARQEAERANMKAQQERLCLDYEKQLAEGEARRAAESSEQEARREAELAERDAQREAERSEIKAQHERRCMDYEQQLASLKKQLDALEEHRSAQLATISHAHAVELAARDATHGVGRTILQSELARIESIQRAEAIGAAERIADYKEVRVCRTEPAIYIQTLQPRLPTAPTHDHAHESAALLGHARACRS